jgi:DNA ligase 1
MNKIFPTIYKLTSTGAVQQWTISVDGNVITTRHGQVGGTMQEATDTIREGKNIGRANETTPAEQAVKEAESKLTRKLKKDYVRTEEAAMAGKSSELVKGGITVMLAHRYDKYPHKIVYPAYVQPKLDGHRCPAVTGDDGTATLWSRTRKPIISMPHIARAVTALGVRHPLDGELYNVDYADRFEELSSLIRPAYAKEGHEVVHYHVYDTAQDLDFEDRYAWLQDKLAGCELPIVLVETRLVQNESEMLEAFEEYLAQGYEGLIIRNRRGKYVAKRSYDLQKVKRMADAEYRIVGVDEGRGSMVGCGVFVCETADGSRFNAKMTGKLADLKKYLDDPQAVIGRMLTVQYQGITTKSQVPRFPVGLRLCERL